MKECVLCKKSKQLSDFHNRKDTLDGKEFRCKECRSLKHKKTYVKKRQPIVNDLERRNALKRELYRLNPENYKKNSKKWAISHREERNKYNRSFLAQRRAMKLRATIPGFEEELKKIYMECPKGFHVDHIVPLKGKNVRGLHVPWNLQYLTATDNLIKGNRI
jgi:hypothetical protein